MPLVIPSFDLGENAVYLFKTPHHERLRRDFRVPIWAVAMATSAAPTYFPAFRLPSDHVRLVDGGVWANNPAMVGVTEAVSMFGRRSPQSASSARHDDRASRRARQARQRGLRCAGAAGRTSWMCCSPGKASGAFAQVQHLIGADNAHRLNPPAPAELARLDACDARDLMAKAAHHSRLFAPTFESVSRRTAAPFTRSTARTHRQVPMFTL